MVKSKGKLVLVQYFRGLAALLVVLHHSSGFGLDYLNYKVLNKVFNAGWTGVDFFFVLSGFIIYYVHHKDIGIRHKVKSFYLKRIIRVYPIYLIITLFLIPLFFIVPSWGKGYETNFDVILKSLILFPQLHRPILEVGWTLVYEIFFYAIFGLIIYMKPKYANSVIAIWIVGILLNAFNVIDFGDNYYLNFIFSNNNLEFIFGCLIAYFILKDKVKYKFIWLSLGLLGFISGWYLVIQGYLQRYQTQSILVFGISFALILVAAVAINLQSNVKVSKLILLIGEASYSIYLTHFYVLLFLFKLITKVKTVHKFNEFIIIPVLILIAVIAGIVFHLVIEKPLTNYLNTKFVKRNKSLGHKDVKKIG